MTRLAFALISLLLLPVQVEADVAQETREQADEPERQAERDSGERELDAMGAEYADAIRNHVEEHWVERSSQEVGGHARVEIRQDSRGNVTQVRMLDCDGGSEFCGSVREAVLLASPLPEAPHPDLFSPVIRFAFDTAG